MNEDIIYVLNSIVWYNGLYEQLLKLKEDIVKQKNNDNYLKINENLEPKFEGFNDAQFEIFWMMLVLLYGDYGTSPRTGWLLMENKEKIIKFIDDITKLSLEGSND